MEKAKVIASLKLFEQAALLVLGFRPKQKHLYKPLYQEVPEKLAKSWRVPANQKDPEITSNCQLEHPYCCLAVKKIRALSANSNGKIACLKCLLYIVRPFNRRQAVLDSAQRGRCVNSGHFD